MYQQIPSDHVYVCTYVLKNDISIIGSSTLEIEWATALPAEGKSQEVESDLALGGREGPWDSSKEEKSGKIFPAPSTGGF